MIAYGVMQAEAAIEVHALARWVHLDSVHRADVLARELLAHLRDAQ